jgi:CubicO group peptidase (beta-lactamase class C family)
MWIASCSKLVTSIAVLQCVERGLFDLDSTADVGRLLPEWCHPKILAGFEEGRPVLTNATKKITLRTLLSHTSGLAYDFLSPTLLEWRQSQGEGSLAMSTPITECFTHPLLFEPGTGWAYGPGLDVAGLMVARANDCTLEQYMRKYIFDPLGMNATSFRPRTVAGLEERLMPMTYRPSPEEALTNKYVPNAGLHTLPLDPVDEFGGAGLFGSAEDYLKLLKSLLRNDGKLLKPESMDALFISAIDSSSEAELCSTLSNPNYAPIMIPGEALVGSPTSGRWTHGLGSLIGLTENDTGLKAPRLQWGGAPNLKWWIDRAGGSCGIFATQLMPAGETNHVELYNIFRCEMVKKFGGTCA